MDQVFVGMVAKSKHRFLLSVRIQVFFIIFLQYPLIGRRLFGDEIQIKLLGSCSPGARRYVT